MIRSGKTSLICTTSQLNPLLSLHERCTRALLVKKKLSSEKFYPRKNFSGIVLKIFVHLAKSCLPDFSSVLHVSYYIRSSTLIIALAG